MNNASDFAVLSNMCLNCTKNVVVLRRWKWCMIWDEAFSSWLLYMFILGIKWEKPQSGASWSGSVEFSWEICACDLPVHSEMVDMSTDSKPPWRRGQTRSVWKLKESPKDIGQPTSLSCCMISSSSAVWSNLNLARVYFQIVEGVFLLWQILECKPLMIIWHLLAFEKSTCSWIWYRGFCHYSVKWIFLDPIPIIVYPCTSLTY